MLDVITAGLAPDLVPYAAGLDLQRRIHAEVAAGARPDTLLLLEHEPVFTAGRRTEAHERPVDGTPVVDVDRGGKITWHGPGQLVGYPIVRLGEPVDVVAYVRRLEAVIIDALAAHGVAGQRVPGRSGVWIHRPAGTAKLAAIGIRVQSGTTMHGFAINCDNALDAFSRIIPCGIADAGVTTASEVAGRPVTPAGIAGTVAAALRAEFGTVAA
ncbi:lipoyl(octanoyl) transferase LipB [Agromyces archimandritae]|uniref:Octanoyltransferase n=1 Tax=Agromyces archimandritae TaxID=2781962 RepID=A0A975FM62_9MICO|nr:lipoyl(octanoyl) transferase LipB [Agromyces archimandritae]QTX04466.1 lipoyl(octanoyl) transferase LipB [Agromyces archimandritae]